MKNILLPTDFSKNSYNAINYAMQLFNNLECTFYVLNVQKQSEFVLDDLMTMSSSASVHEAITKDNKTEIQNFISKIKKNHNTKEFKFKPLFDYDNLIHSINEAVKIYDIDLIIMGTNGATDAKEIIFGSNTLNVINKVNTPTLIIPENYTFKSFKNVLFSTEDCNNPSQKSLLILKELIAHHNAALNVLDIVDSHSLKETTNHKTCLKLLFGELRYNYYKITDMPAPMAINATTQLLDFDMHTLFIESKSFLERFLFRSHAHKISYRTRVPLLVMH